MAAFVFAHVRFFGVELPLQLPAARADCSRSATAILPLFIKIRDLGLLDTHWGVVLPQVAFGLAVSILLFRNFFRQLPGELLRGRADRRLRLLRVLPLTSCCRSSRPILATVAVITFVHSWNSYLLPLVVLNTRVASTRGRWASWTTRASTRPTGS